MTDNNDLKPKRTVVSRGRAHGKAAELRRHLEGDDDFMRKFNQEILDRMRRDIGVFASVYARDIPGWQHKNVSRILSNTNRQFILTELQVKRSYDKAYIVNGNELLHVLRMFRKAGIRYRRIRVGDRKLNMFSIPGGTLVPDRWNSLGSGMMVVVGNQPTWSYQLENWKPDSSDQ